MESENKYNEALKRAAIAYKGGDKSLKASLEQVFPELREDENERIKKALIEYIKKMSGDYIYGIPVEDTINWLDKQGEPNPYSGTSFEYNGHTWGMCARDGGVEISYDRNLKAFLSSEKSIIYPNNHSRESTAPESVMEAVKEENVSNSAKEDKLKFKIGDWIVNPKGEALHITDIDGSCYVFNNNKSHFWITCYCDQQCHLWTIEDAKDGDILCTYECDEPKIIFTLKGTPKKHYALRYYSYYNLMYPHLEPESDGGGLAPEDGDVKPATKWQCDILRQKLKDAGYEWNSENRKLIKE